MFVLFKIRLEYSEVELCTFKIKRKHNLIGIYLHNKYSKLYQQNMFTNYTPIELSIRTWTIALKERKNMCRTIDRNVNIKKLLNMTRECSALRTGNVFFLFSANHADSSTLLLCSYTHTTQYKYGGSSYSSK